MELQVDLDFECEYCGADLDVNSHKNNYNTFVVEPCPKCIEEAKDNAHDTGYKEGYSEGEEAAS